MTVRNDMSSIWNDSRVLRRCADGYDWNTFNDSEYLYFGDANDVSVRWTGSVLQMLPVTNDTGSFDVGNGTLDMDVRFYGTTAGNYLHWDQSGDDLLLVGTATQFAVAGTAESISTTTGSLRTAGGLACVGDFYAGDDIFLTSAAVINWAAGNVTLTHATNKLTFAGVTNGVLVGVHDWGVGSTGQEISTTVPLFQIGGKVATANATAGVYASSYSQLALTANQNADVSMMASWNELYITGANLTGASNFYSVWGHVEVAGTTVGSVGNLCALNGSLIIPSGYTNPSGGSICGCKVDAILHTSMTNNGRTSAFEVGSHIDPNQGDWDYGLYIPASQVTTGIYIGSCTQSIYANSGTLASNGRMAQFYGTIATPALEDGYGTFEIDLSITGTATGQANATSTWINLGTDATIPGYMFVHTDGIYDGTATLTNASISMQKYSCLLASNPQWLSIWELNYSQDANNVIDSIFNCNDVARALGYTTGTSAGNLIGAVPFMSSAGGAVKYVYIYDSPPA